MSPDVEYYTGDVYDCQGRDCLPWWPDAVAHREAVEEAMTAFGFYVARRIARGWSAIEAP